MVEREGEVSICCGFWWLLLPLVLVAAGCDCFCCGRCCCCSCLLCQLLLAVVPSLLIVSILTISFPHLCPLLLLFLLLLLLLLLFLLFLLPPLSLSRYAIFQRKRTKSLFRGLTFWVSQSVVPERRCIRLLIEGAGGVVDDKRPSATKIAQACNAAIKVCVLQKSDLLSK